MGVKVRGQYGGGNVLEPLGRPRGAEKHESASPRGARPTFTSGIPVEWFGRKTRLVTTALNYSYVLLTVCLALTACSTPTDPNPDPVIPPGVDTGSLQVTVVGLPTNVDAAVEVTGPEDYQQTLKRSQTLKLPTGTYTVTIASVTASGITYAGKLDVETVDVTLSQTSAVTATYTTVGQVGPNEIAPGVTRTGQVPEGALKDYQIKGVANVPLLFDFDGTDSNPGIAQYMVEFYKADDLTTPLFSERYDTNNFRRDQALGLAPQEDGDYLLRIRGLGGTVVYKVTASYLSGSPAERATVRVLEFGDEVEGGVTKDSFDTYRFKGTAGQSVVLDFDEVTDPTPITGQFQIEVYAAGGSEPLVTSTTFNANRGVDAYGFTPEADGDYEVRLVGVTGVIQYSFTFKGVE